jgi:hypothetical protein
MTTLDDLKQALTRKLVEESEPKRIDPKGCGCTGCYGDGFSKPLELATIQDLYDMVQGRIHDATSLDAAGLLAYLEERES